MGKDDGSGAQLGRRRSTRGRNIMITSPVFGDTFQVGILDGLRRTGSRQINPTTAGRMPSKLTPRERSADQTPVVEAEISAPVCLVVPRCYTRDCDVRVPCAAELTATTKTHLTAHSFPQACVCSQNSSQTRSPLPFIRLRCHERLVRRLADMEMLP